MLKAFKYQVYPTEEQKSSMDKHFGCSRFIYNWALDKKIKAYQQDQNKISCFELINSLPKLKEEHEWLSEVYSQCLQMSIRNLDNAFTSFFRKNNKFPQFKSKHKSKQSCQYPQGINVDFENNQIFFPKIGKVKSVLHRKFEGKIKTATLSKSSTNKYFISILVDDSEERPNKVIITENTTIGIDVGIKTFATISNGKKVDNPKFLKQSEKRLSILQKRLSKKKLDSKNRKEAKLLVAERHEKVTNQRNDFLHKLSYSLVSENQVAMIVCEDLNIKGMMKNHKLAKSISDVSWNRFNSFLEYKCDWYGKTYSQIGRFDASSKICNVCGFTNNNLTLKDRSWDCSSCKTTHDRDENASINIKKFGYIRFLGTVIELKQSPSEQLNISSER